MTPTSRYVHGTHPEEQRRLADLNALVNHASLEALAARPGERALDVGSGLGQFARALARVTGERVVAVERSPEQIARAVALAADAGEEPLVDFRAGDPRSLAPARAPRPRGRGGGPPPRPPPAPAPAGRGAGGRGEPRGPAPCAPAGGSCSR